MTGFAKRVAAVAGVLVAGLGLACANDQGADPNATSTARVFLTDAPFPYDLVDRVEVYVVEIAASTRADTGAGATQGWITIARPRQRFDLLQLQQGATALLGEGQLPADQYRAVRLTLEADSSFVMLRDGRQASVDWQTTVSRFSLYALVEDPIAVPSAGADIVIDFDVGRSFLYGISFCCDFIFIPYVRAVNAAATGSIAGTVRADLDNDGDLEPVPNARVTVSHGDPARRETWSTRASGHTDALGRYRIAYLRPATYIVEIDAPGRVNVGARVEPTVSVSVGIEAPLSVDLPNGAALRIQGSRFVVRMGETIALEAVVTDAVGAPEPDPPVAWTSRNPSVVTVESTPDTQRVAWVTGTGAGQAYVVATSGVLLDSVLIRAVVDTTGGGGGTTDSVATVTVLPETATLSVGDSTFFQAVLRNAGGAVLTGRLITWAVSDSAVLHLFNNQGEYVAVRPLKAGTVSLTARSEGKSGSAAVQVR